MKVNIPGIEGRRKRFEKEFDELKKSQSSQMVVDFLHNYNQKYKDTAKFKNTGQYPYYKIVYEL